MQWTMRVREPLELHYPIYPPLVSCSTFVSSNHLNPCRISSTPLARSSFFLEAFPPHLIACFLGPSNPSKHHCSLSSWHNIYLHAGPPNVCIFAPGQCTSGKALADPHLRSISVEDVLHDVAVEASTCFALRTPCYRFLGLACTAC